MQYTLYTILATRCKRRWALCVCCRRVRSLVCFHRRIETLGERKSEWECERVRGTLLKTVLPLRLLYYKRSSPSAQAPYPHNPQTHSQTMNSIDAESSTAQQHTPQRHDAKCQYALHITQFIRGRFIQFEMNANCVDFLFLCHYTIQYKHGCWMWCYFTIQSIRLLTRKANIYVWRRNGHNRRFITPYNWQMFWNVRDKHLLLIDAVRCTKTPSMLYWLAVDEVICVASSILYY